ncbi:MAG: hypothetical protein K2X81_18165 [Candidatus Obscuribacterales bacterium]|nr:hypothetical protein [Candidatus Obscuribacterales bacterium]
MGTEASIEARDKSHKAEDVSADLSSQQWAKPEKIDAPSKPNLVQNDSATKALGQLTIDDNFNVRPVDKSEAGDAAKDGPQKLGDKGLNKAAAITREANEFLMKAADQTVNQSIYQLPKWASLPKPTPDVGCVSSFSNRYREALQLSGIIPKADDKQYRDLYQVNMDDFNKVMGKNQLLKPISESEAKEGDIVEGLNPGTTSRHMGIVGRIENDQRTVYDNYGGKWRHEPLEARFGKYQEKHYFRAYLPKEK